MLPISSRNKVPRPTSWNRPDLAECAPVKTPFSCPNNSLSSNGPGRAAQLLGSRSCSEALRCSRARPAARNSQHGGAGPALCPMQITQPAIDGIRIIKMDCRHEQVEQLSIHIVETVALRFLIVSVRPPPLTLHYVITDARFWY